MELGKKVAFNESTRLGFHETGGGGVSWNFIAIKFRETYKKETGNDCIISFGAWLKMQF